MNRLITVLATIFFIASSIHAQQDPEEFVTKTLPKWSIKKEVKIIEKSLENYNPLIESLSAANQDLKKDLANYLKNPSDQVLAAKITAKMSSFAKKIVGDIDTIVSDQDVLLAVFNELDQKLNKFTGYLDFKVQDLDRQVKQHEQKNAMMKKNLGKLARRYKEESDPKQKEQYKREFRRAFNRYNLSVRYSEGFKRNREDYKTLSKNLKSMVKLFVILHEAFDTLIENLAAEKKYLLDNIRLQADAIKVQRLVQEGISDGSRAVVNITKKLALLYTQVEGFTKVHQKINQDMARFVGHTKILNSLVQEIESTPFQSTDVDEALEYFANERDDS